MKALKVIISLIAVSSQGFCELQIVQLQKYAGPESNQVTSVSRDGSLVMGSSGATAVTWNQLGEVTSKGLGIIWDADATGSVFVGHTDDLRPAIWKNGENSQPILGNALQGSALSITANGRFSVGDVYSSVVPQGASKFDLQVGQSSLILADSTSSIASRITPDGNTVVGTLFVAYLDIRGFRKVGNNAIQELGNLEGGWGYCEPFDVSDDGEIVVGISGNQPFRWTEQAGIVSLGPSVGYGVVSISGDGGMIIGNLGDVPVGWNGTDFIWSNSQGLRNLKMVVEAGGVDLSEWVLERVEAISYDGNVIAGTGVRNGDQQCWMITGFSQMLTPTIRIEKLGADYVIKFRGVLQQSNDLGNVDAWEDVPGNPTSEYTIAAPLSGRKFYRARSF
ncbi:MAG: hypothetical protein ACRCXD_04935 [Luteolibacter sp.]